MKFLWWSSGIVALGLVLVAALLFRSIPQPAGQQGQGGIELRLSESMPAYHPSAQASQRFADLVNERSEGRIHISVFYSGELGTEAETLEQMQFGGIAFGRVGYPTLVDTFDELGGGVEPFDFLSTDDMMDRLEDDKSSVNEQLNLEQLMLLAFLYPDLRCIASAAHPLRNREDARGLSLKASSSPLIMRMLRALEIRPVTIESGDIFRSLSNGFIDGTESTLMEYYQNKNHLLLPYVCVDDYFFFPDALLSSGVSLGGLNRSDQAMIEQCAADARQYHREILSQLQEAAVADLSSNPVIHFTDGRKTAGAAP